MDGPYARLIPALTPPPGVKSNFDNPYSQGNIEIAFATIFLVIATLGVVARTITKTFIIENVRLEDCKLEKRLGSHANSCTWANIFDRFADYILGMENSIRQQREV
jgi:hypothetical protein